MLVPGVWFVNRHRFLPSVVIAYIPLRLGEYCPASTIFAAHCLNKTATDIPLHRVSW